MDNTDSKLTELYLAAKQAIEEYNKLALVVNHSERLAIVQSSSDRDYYHGVEFAEKTNLTHEQHMISEWERYPDASLYLCGADSAWFPSFAQEC